MDYVIVQAVDTTTRSCDALTRTFMPNGHHSSSPKLKVKESTSPTSTSTTTGLQEPTSSLRVRSQYTSMISPRSSNYDRLEGGMGPSKTGSAKRFAWKKFAIVAAVLIGVVYLFGPRASTKLPWKPLGKPTGMYCCSPLA